MKCHNFFAIPFLFIVGSSIAAPNETKRSGLDQLPAAARSEIIKKFRALKDVYEVAYGDINQDGIEDLAAIIHSVEGDLETENIIVLKGLIGVRYSLVSASAP